MRLSKSKIFLFCLLSFINGVAIRSFFVIEPFYIFCILLFGFVILFKGVIARSDPEHREGERRGNPRQIIGLMIIFFSLGIFRYQVSIPKSTPDKIWFYNEQKITFVGIVTKEPDERINGVKYTMESKWHIANGKSQKVKGKVLVTTLLYPKFEYGDKLQVTCRLKAPEPFKGFDYDRYLARYDVYSVCYYPEIKFISKDEGNYILSKILSFKSKLKSKVNKNLPEPQASLFNAIILGSRRGIPQELYDKFAAAGAAHLIAISGLHITIIAAILMILLNHLYISRNRAFYLITLILLLYLTIIGFPASAVRASIMAWLMLLAYKIGRLSQANRALVFVATLLILINPKILRDDVGFQLSFLAVLGIIYFSPLFDKWLEKVPRNFGLKSILQMTFSAQIMTLPVVLYNFGRLSLVSPVTNILILPVLPYLMIISFITLIASSLISLNIIWWPAWLFLTYIIKVIEILFKIPYASVDFKISGLVVVVLYFLIGWFLYKKRGTS